MFNVKINLGIDEKIEIIRPANHFVGIEGVGGKIIITDQRFEFKSHTVNIQVHEMSFQYSEILKIEYYNSLGIIHNGLKLTLTSGKVEKFVVRKRSMIKQAILNNKKNL